MVGLSLSENFAQGRFQMAVVNRYSKGTPFHICRRRFKRFHFKRAKHSRKRQAEFGVC